MAGPNRQAARALLIVTLGKSKVGVGVIVGVRVMVGVSVRVGVAVSVEVYVGVNVEVEVAVGVNVFVHTAAVAVWMVAVMVACASGERLQAERSTKANSSRIILRCILFFYLFREWYCS